MALQLTGMNERLARDDSRWIAAATSSLPVPLSPSMRTGESVTATLPMMSLTLAIEAEDPTSSLTASSSPRRARRVWSSPRRNRRSIMRAMRWRNSSRIRGFDR